MNNVDNDNSAEPTYTNVVGMLIPGTRVPEDDDGWIHMMDQTTVGTRIPEKVVVVDECHVGSRSQEENGGIAVDRGARICRCGPELGPEEFRNTPLEHAAEPRQFRSAQGEKLTFHGVKHVVLESEGYFLKVRFTVLDIIALASLARMGWESHSGVMTKEASLIAWEAEQTLAAGTAMPVTWADR
eukprot:4517027-Amphidinium_carterae.1